MMRNRYLILILLSAALLRLYALDRMALWGDEACMVYLCQETPSQIVSALASADRPDVDVAPPVYFLLLHAWMRLFGNSVGAFRGFSVLFGVLTVWVIAGIGSTLFNRQTGLVAAFLAAIHPFQIWYSQEGRMYSLATFLAALTILLLARALNKPENRFRWVTFALSGLTLLYTQYYGALLVTALVIHAVFAIRKTKATQKTAYRSLACVILFWIAGFSPWLPVLLTDYRHAGAPGGFPLMFHWLISPAYLFLKNILFGVEMYVRNYLWLYPVPLIIGILYLLAALESWKKQGVQLLVLSFAFPFGVVYLLSLAGMRVYKSHPFILFHPAILVLLAYGMMQIPRTPRRITAALFVAAQIFVLATLVLGGPYTKPEVHDVADWIEINGGREAVVAVIPAFMPNPMPIVGDLLAFRYHSGDRFETAYLYGDTAAELVEGITAHAHQHSMIYIVYQDNEHVRPYVDEVLRALENRWTRVVKELFPSESRDFSMAVVVYDIHPV